MEDLTLGGLTVTKEQLQAWGQQARKEAPSYGMFLYEPSKSKKQKRKIKLSKKAKKLNRRK